VRRLLAAAAALAAFALVPSAHAADLRGAGGLRLAEVGEFDAPVYVASPPRDRKRLFVVERPGKVLVQSGNRAPRTFLDISDRVSVSGERGLLSMAFAPNYRKSGKFYVYYAAQDGAITIDEYRRASGSRADPASRREIASVPHPGAFHNGGTVAFGPDGRLYLAIGENGNGELAQDPESRLGKLLEVFPRDPGKVRVVATGLRNPFRFSFDPRTKTIAIGDVGQGEVEEINYLKLADARGANFGWPAFEGNAEFDSSPLVNGPHSPPMHTYSHDGGGCSVTGGLTVRDRGLGSLAGRYVYADLCVGELRSFEPDVAANQARGDSSLGLEMNQPVGFGTDGRGRVYVASLGGAVYRLSR
jgi:hypothetical protein